MGIKKYEEFINEGVISTVRNKLNNFDNLLNNRKEEIKGLLRGMLNMNDGVEMISGGVKIIRDDKFYYLYTNGKVILPQGNEFKIDEEDAKKLFYEFIKKKEKIIEAFGSKLTQYGYKVKRDLLDIICNEKRISEKDFKRIDVVQEMIDLVFEYNPEIDEIIKRYDQQNKRISYCAEHIYDWFIKGTEHEKI